MRIREISRLRAAILALVLSGCVGQPMLRDANVLFERGDYAAAEPLFTQVIDNPDSSKFDRLDAYLRRGEVRLELGRSDEAITDGDAALAVFPDVRGHYLRARAYRRNGAWSAAVEDFNRVIEAYHLKQRRMQREAGAAGAPRTRNEIPTGAEPAVRSAIALGEIALIREEYPAAIAAFDTAAALAPDYPEVYLKRGGAYRLMEAEEQAARDLRKYSNLGGDAAVTPESVLAPLQLKEALARYAAGDYPAAIEKASKALELQPNYLGAALCRGHSQARLGRHLEALEDFNLAVRLAPENLEARIYRAFSLTELGQYAAAEKEIDFVLEKEPDNPHALLQRGFAAMGKGRYGDAEAAFSKILEHDPAHERARLYRGISRYKSDDGPGAVADFRDLIQRSPDSVRAHYLLALALYQRREYKEALAAIDKALELEGRNSEYFHLRGILHYHVGHTESALVDLDEAITLAPGNGKLYMSRGVVKGSLGRMEEAAADYALARNPPAHPPAPARPGEEALQPETAPLAPE